MRRTDTHLFFWDTIYSQWHSQPRLITDENGVFYSSAEQFMMAHKALVFGDNEIYKKIMNVNSPRQVKALGRQIKGFTDEEWNKHKIKIVAQGNYLKFSQNENLKQQMIKDKDLILVEASPVDKIWGIGLHFEDDDVLDETKWRGQNLLGVCLTIARDQIIKEMNEN